MTSNVACSTPGCTNPVVGQCGGYNSKCGRFYCTEHSTSYSSGTVLCSVCAERYDIDWKEQQRQAEIQRIYEDYLETAKQIKPFGFVGFLIIIITTGILFISQAIFLMLVLHSFHIDTSSDTGGGAFSFACSMIFWFFVAFYRIINKEHKIKERINEIDKEKPGFKDFYTAWKSNRDKEASQLVGALALGAFLATGEEVVRRQRLRSDVRIIKDEWRKP